MGCYRPYSGLDRHPHMPRAELWDVCAAEANKLTGVAKINATLQVETSVCLMKICNRTLESHGNKSLCPMTWIPASKMAGWSSVSLVWDLSNHDLLKEEQEEHEEQALTGQKQAGTLLQMVQKGACSSQPWTLNLPGKQDHVSRSQAQGTCTKLKLALSSVWWSFSTAAFSWPCRSQGGCRIHRKRRFGDHITQITWGVSPVLVLPGKVGIQRGALPMSTSNGGPHKSKVFPQMDGPPPHLKGQPLQRFINLKWVRFWFRLRIVQILSLETSISFLPLRSVHPSLEGWMGNPFTNRCEGAPNPIFRWFSKKTTIGRGVRIPLLLLKLVHLGWSLVKQNKTPSEGSNSHVENNHCFRC